MSSDSTWRARIARGRDLLPPRWGWVALWATPSSYLLLASLVLVATSKARSLTAMRDISPWPAVWLWSVCADVAVHAGLAALFAFAEARRPWLMTMTLPLALLVAVMAAINAGFLAAAGEQLSFEALEYGMASTSVLIGIVSELVSKHRALVIAGAALAVLAPLVARRLVRSRQAGRPHAAHCAAWLAACALVIWLVVPAPSALAAATLGRNATMHTYWSWVTAEDAPADAHAGDIEFLGYEPVDLVAPEQIAALSTRARPNLLVLILESTRHDVTALAEPPGAAVTPNLAALARQGTYVPVTRAVLPHTTKSVFSILCGRMPLMQRLPAEVSSTVRAQCLPAILGAAGYATAFFQSALGTFEQRPRLVAQLGYQHFEAWEEVGGEPLGYLASDDESLAPAVDRWLGTVSEPFMATVLTSAPHHSYRLPQRMSAHAAGTDQERYARLVEAEDRLLGTLLAMLERRGLRERTIVVVAGDHGEGFGARGVRQHDNNFYEEGLRVPLVFAGPGVPVSQVRGNASLIDVTPSLLHLLGLPVPRVALGDVPLAFDLFAGDVPDEPRWFGCFYETHCRGFVLGTRKVVYMPQTSRVFHFDLAADPGEQVAQPLTPELAEHLPALHLIIDSHRTRRYPLVLGEIPPYGQWTCPLDNGCTHPRSPPGFFGPP